MGYVDLLFEGLNQNLLLKKLNDGKICVLRAQIIDKKHIILRVRAKDNKKVFAICNNMWYNKQVGQSFDLRLLQLLKTRIVFFFGVLLIVATSYFASFFVFDVQVNCKNAQIKQKVECCTTDLQFALFKQIDTAKLLEKIYKSDSQINFVSTKKFGNRLIIDVFYSNNQQQIKNFGKQKIVSTVKGEVLDIRCYRGTSMVAVGDTVSEGDLLIDGVYVSQDRQFSTYALGFVAIKSTYECEIEVKATDAVTESQLIARAIFCSPAECETDVLSAKIDCTSLESGAIYKIIVDYVTIIGE